MSQAIENIKKSESKVRKNATELDLIEKKLAKGHKGEFVAFLHGQYHFFKSLKEAISTGNEKFGADSGFVVRELGKPTPVLAYVGKR